MSREKGDFAEKKAVSFLEDLGFKIADAIFEFSKLDKIGHQSFAFNFSF